MKIYSKMSRQVFFYLLCVIVSLSSTEAQERAIRSGDPSGEPAVRTSADFQVPPKVDPRIRDFVENNPGKTVPLLLYLRAQPVHSIRRQVEARNVVRTESVQMRMAKAAAQRDEAALAGANDAMRELTLHLRREIFTELEPATRSLQEPVVRRLINRGVQVQHRFTVLNMLRVEAPANALDELYADEEISEIGLDMEMRPQLDVSVPALETHFLWNAGYTGTGQSVLVIDSGVQSAHPAFGDRVRLAVFTQNNPNCSAAERNDPRDFNGHGTHVAGIIASAGTGALPRHLGVAPNTATIYSGKISCENGRSFSGSVLEAAQQAIQWTDVKIVNNSNGGATLSDDDFQSRRIDELVDLFDLTWVNAAGNDGPTARSINSPGTAYNVISVAAMDTVGTAPRSQAVVANFSSRGPTIGGRRKPDVSAPGVNIYSASHLNPGFVPKEGTSMAAPHVAGAALLLRQAGVPDRRALKALLINTTDESGWDTGKGWGYVNLRRALEQSSWLVRGNLNSSRGASQLIVGTMAADRNLFVTLAWNRFVRGGGQVQFLRNLDIVAYRGGDGAVLRRSSSTLDNVEQLSIPKLGVATPIAISVTGLNDGNGFTEPFAMAVSESGFRVARGVQLQQSCSGPTTIAPGSTVRVTCQFSNIGDITGFTSQAQIRFAGLAPTSPVELGRTDPGASTTRTFDFTAPLAVGDAQIIVSTTSLAYGLVFPGEASYRVTIQGSTPPNQAPLVTGVVNGASFGNAISSGSWVTISGSRFSANTRIWGPGDFVGDRLPTSLDGVRVNMNGRAAYVYFISPTQINVLAPDDATTGLVTVEVTTNAGRSNMFNVQKVPFSPALFLFDAGGRRYPAAVHPDGTLLAPAGLFPSSLPHRPARPGDTVLVFGTGCGPTTPPVLADRIVSGAYPTANRATATIGGLTAETLFAGIVGSGLCQFNVKIPSNAGTGDQMFGLQVGGIAAQSAFIPIQR